MFSIQPDVTGLNSEPPNNLVNVLINVTMSYDVKNTYKVIGHHLVREASVQKM